MLVKTLACPVLEFLGRAVTGSRCLVSGDCDVPEVDLGCIGANGERFRQGVWHGAEELLFGVDGIETSGEEKRRGEEEELLERVSGASTDELEELLVDELHDDEELLCGDESLLLGWESGGKLVPEEVELEWWASFRLLPFSP